MIKFAVIINHTHRRSGQTLYQVIKQDGKTKKTEWETADKLDINLLTNYYIGRIKKGSERVSGQQVNDAPGYKLRCPFIIPEEYNTKENQTNDIQLNEKPDIDEDESFFAPFKVSSRIDIDKNNINACVNQNVNENKDEKETDQNQNYLKKIPKKTVEISYEQHLLFQVADDPVLVAPSLLQKIESKK